MFNFAQNYLTHGLWGDEAWTSLISQLPYLQMLKTTAADFHPPAYYTIVGLVYKFLAPTEIVTRTISIFFYLATIYLVYLLSSKFKGRTVGILSAILVAVNPIFFRYAFEARNYMLFAFAAGGSVYFLLRLSEKFTRRDAIFFVIFSTLGIYTHYYMFFTLAAEGLYILLFSARGETVFGRDSKLLQRIFGLFAICGVLYLPWIPFLARQVASAGSSYWIGALNNRTHYEALARILAGEADNVFKPFLFWISTGLIIVGLYHHLIVRRFEKPPLRPFDFAQGLAGRAYVLIWIWAIIPFILASLPGLKIGEFKFPLRPLFFWRYLIGASVPLSIIIVHSGQKFSPKLFKASMGAVIILAVLIDLQTFFSNPYSFRDVYRNQVINTIRPGDSIVTVLPSFAEVLYYHNRFGLDNRVVVLPEGLVQFSGKSLLDAYAANGVVTIEATPAGKVFIMTPGPKLVVSE